MVGTSQLWVQRCFGCIRQSWPEGNAGGRECAEVVFSVCAILIRNLQRARPQQRTLNLPSTFFGSPLY